MAAAEGLGVSANVDLRGLLRTLKEIDPALARAVRKRLRQSGDEAIVEMRRILAEPSKGLVTRVVRGEGTDARGARRRSIALGVESTGSRGRSKGTRDAIAKGIKVAVRTGAKPATQGVRLTSSAPSVAPMARSYNMLRWRHPVRFNSANQDASEVQWVMQAGNPYFGKVLTDRAGDIKQRVLEAIEDAQTEVGD